MKRLPTGGQRNYTNGCAGFVLAMKIEKAMPVKTA